MLVETKKFTPDNFNKKNIIWASCKYLLAVLILSFFFSVNSSFAASIDVDGVDCTLIEAINSANDDISMGNGCDDGNGDDVINLPASSTQTLTAVDNGNNGLPLITTNITINGNGSTIERDSSDLFRIFEIEDIGILTINNTTVTGGSSSGRGGAFLNEGSLTINDSVITDNQSAGDSGAIDNLGLGDPDPILVINNSTISNNTAAGDGGAIFSFGGTVTIDSSTLSGNTTIDGGGNDNGGAIANASGAVITITNSTISGNTSVDGGGGFSISGSTVTVTNSTITDNESTNGGGILVFSGTLNITNTIVANSTTNGVSGGDCDNTGSGSIASSGGTVNDGGNNLIEDSEGDDTSCGLANGDNNNIVGSDPNLGPLQNNGGPTETHALLSGSPAINNGDSTTCEADPVNNLDQRSFPRIAVICDIGSYEDQPTTTAKVTKLTEPTGGMGFDFDVSIITDSDLLLNEFTLDDTDMDTTIIPTGDIRITEDIPGNFALDIDCGASTIGSAPLIDNMAGTVDATIVSTDEFLDCVFTNTLQCDVNVNVEGDGQGTVTGNGINCDETNGPTCTIQEEFGGDVDFDAAEDPGSEFAGFSGDCDSSGVINPVGDLSDDDTPDSCTDTCTATFNDLDDCSPNPCNGGTCTDDGANAFTCDCSGTGLEGDTCDMDIDACVNNPCDSVNGTCTDLPAPALDVEDGRTCGCNEGFALNSDGVTCDPIPDEEIDACENNPCDDNAICTDIIDGPDDESGRTCACDDGFEGSGEPGECDEENDDNNIIEIINEGTDGDGTRVEIRIGSGISGGGQILVNIPPEVKLLFANLIPNVGDCVFVDESETANVSLDDADIICVVDEFPSELDLDLGLCLDDEDAQGIAVAEIEVRSDNSNEEFSEFIDILLNELDECDGDGGGCSIAPTNTSKTNALSNFFVMLIPAIVGFAAMFFRRRLVVGK